MELIITFTIMYLIILAMLIFLSKIFYEAYVKESNKPASNDVIIIGDKNPYRVIYTDNFGKVECETKLYQY